jgi:propanol-preferring alcohol dehydrogenase
MLLSRIVSLGATDRPLEMADLPVPVPERDEVLIRVSACGVCHTELDEIEGRTPPPHLPVVPGHEVVGRIERLGEGATRHELGDRVGVGWIHHSTGGIDENLSPEFRATGRDVDGGYAEFMKVPQRYAYRIPDRFTDAEAAPLLCAGAVGFRALRLAQLRDGDGLGLTGFGGSAHLVLQLARHCYPNSPIFVFARDPTERTFAKELGAAWTGHTTDRAPDRLHAIIDTTPAWKPVVEALSNLRPGGRLVINAIRKIDTDREALLTLSYHEHLWLEREIKTVANVTHQDIEEFLPLAADVPLRPHVTTYRLEEANRALLELHRGRVRGAKVLVLASDRGN